MEQYIPKSKVIEEIKSYKDNFCDRNGYLEDVETNGLAYDTLCELENSIDTLEVKEVDFGTEVYKYIDKHFNVYDDGNQTLQTKDKKSLIGRVDVENIAKYFFELGIKTQKGE